MRSHRSLIGFVVACLMVASLPATRGFAASLPTIDVPTLSAINVDDIAEVVSPVTKELRRPPLAVEGEGIHIALISSGIDKSVFPESIRDRIATPFAGVDKTGWGTLAASILLQSGDLRITSLPAFGKSGKLDEAGLTKALRWASKNSADLDAVLIAAQPHEVLDPISSAMDHGWYNEITDSGPTGDQAELKLQSLTNTWESIRSRIANLSAAGITTVVPAGDLGPRIQTIFGIASISEVITVGASDGNKIVRTSSRGPGLNGIVKPDLVAPGALPGLLPEASKLAESLGERGVLNPDLKPLWDSDIGDPLTDARVSMNSTVASAAVVAAIVGSLHLQGITDLATQRGTLTAASVPTKAPAFDQGAGILKGVPTAKFAESRSLALKHAELGAEPTPEGSWSALVPFSQGVEGAKGQLTTHAAPGPDGETKTRSSAGPALDFGVSNDGVRIGAPIGDSRYQGGLYCGYTDVAVPVFGGTVDPTVTINGVPSGTEQVPTCLIKGDRIAGFSFYIHDMPAENLTFAMLPALPEELSLLEAPFMLLPINPLHTRVYTAVSGADGFAYFPNVIPGYYRILQFSDYGAPVTQTVEEISVGTDVVQTHDIGHNVSYLGFDALVLGGHVTRADLEAVGKVEDDKPHQAYWVTVGPRRLRVVLSKFKKMPGATVSSRVTDLMNYDDLEFSVSSLAKAAKIPALGKAPLTQAMDAWTFAQGGKDPDGVLAAFNPALTGQKVGTDTVGIGYYPFNLTVPNYTLDYSLNFSYQLNNAAIVVAVVVGDETAIGIVLPDGTVQTPVIGASQPIKVDKVPVGASDGTASFNWQFLPQGEGVGHLYMLFVPSKMIGNLTAPLVSASIGDLSMGYETWQRVPWPATLTPYGQGHSFQLNPNFSARQINGAPCRQVAAGGFEAEVCEDWQVQIHSAGDDAATVEILDSSGERLDSLADAGASFFDPNRGVLDRNNFLKVGGKTGIGPVDLDVSLGGPFTVNGRFWEQIVLPLEAIRSTSGALNVQIVDNVAGRGSSWSSHSDGPAPVAPYISFENIAITQDPLSLAEQSVAALEAIAAQPVETITQSAGQSAPVGVTGAVPQPLGGSGASAPQSNSAPPSATPHPQSTPAPQQDPKRNAPPGSGTAFQGIRNQT